MERKKDSKFSIALIVVARVLINHCLKHDEIVIPLMGLSQPISK